MVSAEGWKRRVEMGRDGTWMVVRRGLDGPSICSKFSTFMIS
jgi:hypothetical protein